MTPRIVIVGLGNPILSDDSVGIKVADLLRTCLPDSSGIDVKEAYAGGLRLMDAIAGYDRAIIVDATKVGSCPPGTVTTFTLGDGRETRNLRCSHDGDLETVLAVGRELGLNLPALIEVVGIEAADTENFSEDLTCGVRKALPAAVAAALGCCGIHGHNLHGVTA